MLCRRLSRVVLAIGLITASHSRALFGHDAYEITAEGRVRADRLELHVIMAQRTARQACATDGVSLAFTGPEDFETVREAFARAARGLFVVTAGDATLAPRETTAALGNEGDLEFFVVYPRPAKGSLVFDAVHLQRFEDPTYGVVLTLTSDVVFLGQQLLRADESVMQVALPEAPPPAAQPGLPR